MADAPGRLRVRLNTLIAVMLAAAVVLAIVLGVRAIGLAQTGSLGDAAGVPRDERVLAQPEVSPQQVPVYECRDASGRPVYSNEPCAGSSSAVRGVEVTTIELPPRRP
jgi:hypothetical protein